MKEKNKLKNNKNTKLGEIEELLKAKGDYKRLSETDLNNILRNNIYGVDLDEQAVEIAKLNLLLKATEFKHRNIPLENIKNGNSLIDDKKVVGDKASKWDVEFSDVMNKGGFDIIIGNPPYINELLSDKEKGFFNKKYIASEYQMDTYVLFVEKATKLLSKNGILGFIIPNAWLSNIFAKKFREYILENFNVNKITVLPKDVFSGAIVDTVVLIVSKNKPSVVEVNRLDDAHESKILNVKQQEISKNNNFTIDVHIDSVTKNILDKIEKDSKKLEELCKINRGAHAYRTDGYGKSAYVKGYQTEKDYQNRSYHSKYKKDKTYHKEYRGKNVFKYYNDWGGEWISWGNWLAEPRSWEYFTGCRIALRKIVGETLYATVFNDDAVFDQSVYIALPHDIDYRYLLGILNSKLMVFYFKHKYNEFDELFPQIKVTYFKKLPIKYDEKFFSQINIPAAKMLKLNKYLQKEKEGTNAWKRIKSEIE